MIDGPTAAILMFGSLVAFVGLLWLLDWIARRRDRQSEHGRGLTACSSSDRRDPANKVDPDRPVVHSAPDILSGTPVFAGTRVPFQALIDYLESGQPLSEFLEDFPTVSKDQAIVALEQARDALLERARPA